MATKRKRMTDENVIRAAKLDDIADVETELMHGHGFDEKSFEIESKLLRAAMDVMEAHRFKSELMNSQPN